MIPSQPEVADLEIAGGVQEKVRRLQVAVQHVGGMDVLQAAKNLVPAILFFTMSPTTRRANKLERSGPNVIKLFARNLIS